MGMRAPFHLSTLLCTPPITHYATYLIPHCFHSIGRTTLRMWVCIGTIGVPYEAIAGLPSTFLSGMGNTYYSYALVGMA